MTTDYKELIAAARRQTLPDANDEREVMQAPLLRDLVEALERLTQPVGEFRPVSAEHRFRPARDTMLGWSVWQPTQIENRPAYMVDPLGCEVEYRNLYSAETVARLIAERDALQEQVKLLRGAIIESLRNLGVDYMDKNCCEALAATEPKKG